MRPCHLPPRAPRAVARRRPSWLVPAVLALLLAGLALAAPPARGDVGLVPDPDPAALMPVDRVLVRKGERRMFLYRGEQLVRSYKVSLGLVPDGHKQQEGDFRTPEGRYYLTRRNTQSEFFLSIQVSYPNEQDLASAKRRGVPPGGAIMVHGLPNVLKYSRERYASNDWTDGCIALANDDMLEFWLLTQTRTPIDIEP